MLRKQILTEWPISSTPGAGEKDIAAIATVWVTSEAIDNPGPFAPSPWKSRNRR